MGTHLWCAGLRFSPVWDLMFLGPLLSWDFGISSAWGPCSFKVDAMPNLSFLLPLSYWLDFIQPYHFPITTPWVCFPSFSSTYASNPPNHPFIYNSKPKQQPPKYKRWNVQSLRQIAWQEHITTTTTSSGRKWLSVYFINSLPLIQNVTLLLNTYPHIQTSTWTTQKYEERRNIGSKRDTNTR